MLRSQVGYAADRDLLTRSLCPRAVRLRCPRALVQPEPDLLYRLKAACSDQRGYKLQAPQIHAPHGRDATQLCTHMRITACDGAVWTVTDYLPRLRRFCQAAAQVAVAALDHNSGNLSELSEAERATYGDRWELAPAVTKQKLLGRGGCAVVWLGAYAATGAPVAVKQVSKVG